jgi:homoserine O-acetyltransferase
MTLLPLSPGPAPLELGAFRTESGGHLPRLRVAYRRDGPPDAPAILVVHALTGSADAAGDWWEPLIGPGRAFDTDRYQVICANLLGSCYWTTGPLDVSPLPPITPRDHARVQWPLLDAPGIERVGLVTGGSLGGMVALEIALERPRSVGTVVPIAAPAVIGALARAWNHIQLETIALDPRRGLELARQLALTTYRTEEDFETRGTVETYLEHQGRKLTGRFAVESYRVLVEAMDAHDVGRERGGVVAALGGLAAAGTRLLGIGITGDLLYGPRQVRALVEAASRAGVDTAYRELSSDKGHDAFLVEWDQLTAIFGAELGEAGAAVASAPERRTA